MKPINNSRENDKDNEALFRMLDKGIADMEAGRELPLEEAFQKIEELRKHQ